MDVSEDQIGKADLKISQYEEGYRFGLDAVLLATDLPELPSNPRVVDLGAGQGIVGLSIASRHDDASVLCIERQKSLSELLKTNIQNNRLDNAEAQRLDIRNHRDDLTPHQADLVVSNPPYYPEGQRRPSNNQQRAEARHELHGTLSDFVEAATYILDQRGKLKIIIPPRRITDLTRAQAQTDLSYSSIRFFHSREGESAYLAECLLQRGRASELEVLAPLIVYQGQDEYSEEVKRRIENVAGD